MTFEIRTIGDDERYDAWRQAIGVTFVFEPREDDREFFASINEWDRLIGVYEGEEVIATGGNMTFRMPVPGGAVLPVGGVTAITTLPTHRRRGALREMMRWLQDDSRTRGEIASILWASESKIYGRFGYGEAAPRVEATIENAHARLRSDVEVDGVVRLVSPETARAVIPALYEEATAPVPGAVRREERDWAGYFRDPEHWRDGASPARYAVAYRGSEAVGYATYGQKQKWEDSHPQGETLAHDVTAVDGAASAALWQYLFALDLTTKTSTSSLTLNDPLSAMLEDPRRLRIKVDEGLWVRILDVKAFLEAREYSADGSVVLEISDPMYEDIAGVFRLTVEGGRASVERVDAEADLAMGIEELGCLSLGRGGARALMLAGRIRGDQTAVSLLDRMMWWPVPARCPVNF